MNGQHYYDGYLAPLKRVLYPFYSRPCIWVIRIIRALGQRAIRVTRRIYCQQRGHYLPTRLRGPVRHDDGQRERRPLWACVPLGQRAAPALADVRVPRAIVHGDRRGRNVHERNVHAVYVLEVRWELGLVVEHEQWEAGFALRPGALCEEIDVVLGEIDHEVGKDGVAVEA